MVGQETISALRELGAATVHEASGGWGAIASYIKPIDPACRLGGRALTVDAAPGDNLVLHYALLKAAPGDVLVVDAKGFLEAGPWGDVLTAAAQHCGVAGLVIDGAVRDAAAIQELGFPVFCRGLSIKGTGKNQPGKVGEPIVFGGVPVRTGDIVIGDRDGLVVVAEERAKEVLANSRRRAEKEEEFRRALQEGQTTVDLLGLKPSLLRLGLN